MSEEIPESVPPLTAMPPTAAESARTPVSHFIDARCRHPHHDGSGSAYRMIGGCYNCGLKPVLGLFTATHETSSDTQCPACGCRRMHWDRLASPDEIPATFEADL